MIKVIISDLDDTLILSTGIYRKVTVEVAKYLEMREPSKKEMMKFGETWDAFIQKTWPNLSDQEIIEFKDEYTKRAEKIIYKLVPGTNKALETLNKEYLLFILTKRERERLGFRLEQAKLQYNLFKKIWCNEDLSHQKPNPLTFEVPFAEIKDDYIGTLNKNEVLYVGDNPDDMKAALGFGIWFVAVLSGNYTKEDFVHAGLEEKYIIGSIAKLPNLLKNHLEYFI